MSETAGAGNGQGTDDRPGMDPLAVCAGFLFAAVIESRSVRS
jgi:hypothetical protein